MTQTIKTGLPVPLPERMTYEEFLEWAEDGSHLEWVNGKVVSMSPISKKHNDVSIFLLALIRFFVETHQLGDVQCDPFQMKTGPNLPGRAPDILFVAEAHRSRLQKNHLAGPADLAVEIVSPESARRDRVEKLREYEQGGVREYWLIDPQRKEALFYQLGADHRYQAIAPDTDGIYHSAVLPGLWLNVDWLWQERLPSLLDVLKAWGLVS
jgi:Uma2 family endonuclease